jgi:hypothetical protein
MTAPACCSTRSALWGCETDFGQDMFGRVNFDQLAHQLAGIKARYILSIHDTLGARATCAQFHVATAEIMYIIESGAAQRAGEQIVQIHGPAFGAGRSAQAAAWQFCLSGKRPVLPQDCNFYLRLWRRRLSARLTFEPADPRQ